MTGRCGGDAPWVALLCAVFDRLPKLPDAACCGRPQLFDGEDEETAARAAAICRQCPAREPCGAWRDTLARKQAHGVLVGHLGVWGQPPNADQTQTERKPPVNDESAKPGVPDPVAVFKHRVAGKNITINTGTRLVETGDGAPLGVEPGSTMQFAFDEDGICCPVWETDEKYPEGETEK